MCTAPPWHDDSSNDPSGTSPLRPSHVGRLIAVMGTSAPSLSLTPRPRRSTMAPNSRSVKRRGSVSEDDIVIMRRFVDLISEGDVEALATLVADDYVCHVAGGLAAGAKGPEVWRRRAGALRAAFPDYRITTEDLLTDADKVILRYRAQGTHRGPLFGAEPTGALVTYTGIMIVRISEG